MNELGGYVVLVEWDGGTPPTTWYNRIHENGLFVRGNKDEGPLSRRYNSNHDKGVVFQEGAIVTNSESFAHLLASYAVELGAVAVSVGQMHVERYTMSPTDTVVYERIVAQKSKRGPKFAKDEGTYVVTCLEEAKTFEVELRESPLVCPNCGGFNIEWRKGNKSAVGPADWVRTRFHSGHFEIPDIDTGKGKPSLPSGFDQSAVLDILPLKLVSKFPGPVADRATDVAYCVSKMVGDKKGRINRRSAALYAYYAGGGEKFYSPAVPDEIDIVDLAGISDEFLSYL